MDWVDQIFGHDLLHHLEHFFDRYDFAKLETMSRVMRENARRIIRARNEELPVEKRMANLEGAFCVSVVAKELLKREGRHLLDIIATGGYVRGQRVMSLDLVTKRYTALAPMITARVNHATVVLDGKHFVMGGYNHDRLSSVECS